MRKHSVKYRDKRSVVRNGKTFCLPDLSSPICFTSFQRAIYEGTKDSYTDFILDFYASDRIFPNAAVPIAAYIAFHTNEGITFNVSNAPAYLVTSKLMSPARVSTAAYRDKSHPLARIWRFEEPAEVNELVSLFIEELSTAHVCATGVLESLEWCLNEIMDNVMQHSDGSPGFAMMQLHKATGKLAVCIADHGQGIFSSLSPSKHHPRSTLDSITLAIKPGVTRDPNIGQGNGLWGLSEIVRLNISTLNISSGSASLYFDGTETKTFKGLPGNREYPGAVVDFQINTGRPIDITEALGGTKQHHLNLRMEAFENDLGEHEIIVQEIGHGTGTRRAGALVRTLVLNTFADGARRIILDFKGVGIISSSFADELVGKLVAHFGFSGFCQQIGLRGTNEVVQALIDKSVSQRMSTVYDS